MDTPAHESADEPIFGRPLAPRRRWGAAVLSLFVPGLGHVYAGRGGRGLATAVLAPSVGAGALFLTMVVPVPVLRVFLLLAPFLVVLGVAADAFRAAASAPNRFWGKWYNRWYVYAAIWLAAAFIAQPLVYAAITGHVAQAFAVPSTGMEPTLLRGDYILAAPIRGGPIPLAMPVVYQGSDGVVRVQRIAALPGDTVEMRRKALFINGRLRREAYVQHIDPAYDPVDEQMGWQEDFLARAQPEEHQPSRDNWGPLVVPSGEYLVLGDNRDNSLDSRYLGFVPRERIRRRPVWIYLSRDAVEGEYRWSRLGRGIE
ncbi:MAG TPA: signal peptidase I [Longimicrobium sp.]|jgi:signal peptidase I